MKFRVTAVGYSDDVTQARRDVSLIVDVTSTVREVASGLVRAGAGRPRLIRPGFSSDRFVRHRVSAGSFSSSA